MVQLFASILRLEEDGQYYLVTPVETHIATVGIEKIVPSMEHATVLLRLLSRAAIGAEITQYTTFYNGPKRKGDADGPENMHIVLVDNHRTEMLGEFLRPMLRCIRCGACMNHCPVYAAIGGHAYGSVYPGPMGSVLTPAMQDLNSTKDLPNACTLNGRCKEVCPVNIPLTDMLRSLRARQFERDLTPPMTRYALVGWSWLAQRPKLYHLATSLAMFAMRIWSMNRGRIRWFPMAGGWTQNRDLPQPELTTFMQQYRRTDHK